MANNPIFYFDFGSPNFYLARHDVAGIERRQGVSFQYVPVLLGGLFKMTGNQAPTTAFASVPIKLAYQKHELKRYAASRDIPFAMNPHFPVNTLALMRGAVAAQRLGEFNAYVEAMLHHMWVEPRKLDDPEVLARTLREAGLPEEVLTLSQDSAVKQQLIVNTDEAANHGVFGIPTFRVGKEIFFGKDSLPEVERELIAPALKKRAKATA